MAKRPLWLMAIACSTWLVHSMAESLGGGFWDYVIAAAFDYAPLLLMSAAVNPRYQRVNMIGAVAIFAAGLMLYLAPYAQTLSNEISLYQKASQRFSADMASFEAQVQGSQALVLAKQKAHENAEKMYQKALDTYGEKAWQTGNAKQQLAKALQSWEESQLHMQKKEKPDMPVYSDALRQAVQEIIKRVGLFGIAFLSVFSMTHLTWDRLPSMRRQGGYVESYG